MKLARRISSALAALGLTLALCACGGGSGSVNQGPTNTLSGTAAAGAPIIGKVTIKDSSTPAQTKEVTIATDGGYTVDVTGMKGPFMVRADGYVGGNQYHLYSAATPEDVGHTINITPLTDLIVANVAGSLAQTYFDSGNFSSLTADKLNEQASVLQAKLLPVLQTMGLSASVDLLRTSFSTDHTGLDAALDVIKVSIDPTTQIATLKNVITQEEIKSDLAQQSYSGAMTTTTGIASGATAIQAMSVQLKSFSNLFATSVPSPTDTRLLALFDQGSFLNGGQDLNGFLSEILSDPNMVGITFTNLSIISMNTSQDAAEISFTVLQNGAVANGPGTWNMVKKNGVWLFTGDQKLADISVQSRAEYHPRDSQNPYVTGLNLYVSDRGLRGIDTAVITGKGLPAEGLTLQKQVSTDWFAIAGNYNGTMYLMNDATIDQIADTGEAYTVKLYSNGTLRGTSTEIINKRPYKPSELSAANFAAFSAQTVLDLANFVTGNLTINWTLPAGCTSDHVDVWVANGGQYNQAEYDLMPTATSKVATLEPDFTPNVRQIWLNIKDSFGRELSTNLY